MHSNIIEFDGKDNLKELKRAGHFSKQDSTVPKLNEIKKIKKSHGINLARSSAVISISCINDSSLCSPKIATPKLKQRNRSSKNHSKISTGKSKSKRGKKSEESCRVNQNASFLHENNLCTICEHNRDKYDVLYPNHKNNVVTDEKNIFTITVDEKEVAKAKVTSFNIDDYKSESPCDNSDLRKHAKEESTEEYITNFSENQIVEEMTKSQKERQKDIARDIDPEQNFALEDSEEIVFKKCRKEKHSIREATISKETLKNITTLDDSTKDFSQKKIHRKRSSHENSYQNKAKEFVANIQAKIQVSTPHKERKEVNYIKEDSEANSSPNKQKKKEHSVLIDTSTQGGSPGSKKHEKKKHSKEESLLLNDSTDLQNLTDSSDSKKHRKQEHFKEESQDVNMNNEEVNTTKANEDENDSKKFGSATNIDIKNRKRKYEQVSMEDKDFAELHDSQNDSKKRKVTNIDKKDEKENCDSFLLKKDKKKKHAKNKSVNHIKDSGELNTEIEQQSDNAVDLKSETAVVCNELAVEKDEKGNCDSHLSKKGKKKKHSNIMSGDYIQDSSQPITDIDQKSDNAVGFSETSVENAVLCNRTATENNKEPDLECFDSKKHKKKKRSKVKSIECIISSSESSSEMDRKLKNDMICNKLPDEKDDKPDKPNLDSVLLGKIKKKRDSKTKSVDYIVDIGDSSSKVDTELENDVLCNVTAADSFLTERCKKRKHSKLESTGYIVDDGEQCAEVDLKSETAVVCNELAVEKDEKGNCDSLLSKKGKKKKHSNITSGDYIQDSSQPNTDIDQKSDNAVGFSETSVENAVLCNRTATENNKEPDLECFDSKKHKKKKRSKVKSIECIISSSESSSEMDRKLKNDMICNKLPDEKDDKPDKPNLDSVLLGKIKKKRDSKTKSVDYIVDIGDSSSKVDTELENDVLCNVTAADSFLTERCKKRKHSKLESTGYIVDDGEQCAEVDLKSETAVVCNELAVEKDEKGNCDSLLSKKGKKKKHSNITSGDYIQDSSQPNTDIDQKSDNAVGFSETSVENAVLCNRIATENNKEPDLECFDSKKHKKKKRFKVKSTECSSDSNSEMDSFSTEKCKERKHFKIESTGYIVDNNGEHCDEVNLKSETAVVCNALADEKDEMENCDSYLLKKGKKKKHSKIKSVEYTHESGESNTEKNQKSENAEPCNETVDEIDDKQNYDNLSLIKCKKNKKSRSVDYIVDSSESGTEIDQQSKIAIDFNETEYIFKEVSINQDIFDKISRINIAESSPKIDASKIESTEGNISHSEIQHEEEIINENSTTKYIKNKQDIKHESLISQDNLDITMYGSEMEMDSDLMGDPNFFINEIKMEMDSNLMGNSNLFNHEISGTENQDNVELKPSKKKRKKARKKVQISTAIVYTSDSDNDDDEEPIVKKEKEAKWKIKTIKPTKKLLEDRDLDLDFTVPPLHDIFPQNTFLTHDIRQLINERNITIKDGKYSSIEDKQIRVNWNYFKEKFELESSPADFFYLNPKVIGKDEKKKFLFYLGRNLPERHLGSIFKRFQRLFSEEKGGKYERFTKEEDDIILKMLHLKGTEPNYVVKIAKSLKRTKTSVERRMKQLKEGKPRKIKWHRKQNLATFIKYMLEATNCENVDELKGRFISRNEWLQLSDNLDDVPLQRLKQTWYTILHPRLFMKKNYVDLIKIKRKLVSLMIANGEKDWKLVEWKNYVPYFEGFTSLKLFHLFHNMIKIRVPKSKKHNLKKCLKILNRCIKDGDFQWKHYLTKLIYENGKVHEVKLDAKKQAKSLPSEIRVARSKPIRKEIKKGDSPL